MRVSVIVAAYNVEHFVARAIASVQAQTVSDWEIIVVDDCSSDATGSVVQKLGASDTRIRLLKQPKNAGPSAARNRAIGEVRGTWIAILDADDAWRPERLERLLSFAEDTESDVVGDNQILLDEALSRESGLAFDLGESVVHLDKDNFFARANPLQLGTLKLLFRRDYLEIHSLRYREELRFAEDFQLLGELVLSGAQIHVTPEAYYIYTAPVGAISGTRSASTRSTTSREGVLSILDGLETKYRAALTPAVVAGLERCRRITRKRWIAEQISSFRRERRYGDLAAFLLAHPYGAARYAASSPKLARLVSGASR